MKEQIEKHELSESIYMSGYGLDRKDCDDIAEQLYHEGYRKQSEGKWMFNRGRCYGEPAYYCSNCSEGASEYGMDNFCPNCGAKMKGGAE